MRSAQRGTSLIEVLVALTILSVGLLGFVGTGATVNILLGEGRWATAIAGAAEQRLELIRAAARDSITCAALSNGSGTLAAGVSEQWTIVPGIRSVAVEVVITGRRLRADTVRTVLPCG